MMDASNNNANDEKLHCVSPDKTLHATLIPSTGALTFTESKTGETPLVTVKINADESKRTVSIAFSSECYELLIFTSENKRHIFDLEKQDFLLDNGKSTLGSAARERTDRHEAEKPSKEIKPINYLITLLLAMHVAFPPTQNDKADDRSCSKHSHHVRSLQEELVEAKRCFKDKID
mmetsp:Transcript_78/g.131  ORF Transcript_78/g.131 Transcript_78/m.131 type:complete len:176 (-) Transcript_78:227-754(-)